MRTALAVSLVVALVSGASAVTQTSQQIWVTITASQSPGADASIPVLKSAFYFEDGPAAFIGAPPSIRRVSATVHEQTLVAGLFFTIRAWKEGEKARVVVYATLEDKRAPGGRTDTPIATFLIAPGESVEVPQPEKWGASRVRVSAVLR